MTTAGTKVAKKEKCDQHFSFLALCKALEMKTFIEHLSETQEEVEELSNYMKTLMLEDAIKNIMICMAYDLHLPVSKVKELRKLGPQVLEYALQLVREELENTRS